MKIAVISVMALLTLLTITEGMRIGDQGVSLRCRCIRKETKPIGRHIEKVELIPANSHCKETEIIATLKRSQKRVCLDSNAPWVSRVLERILESKKP